jgi:glycosyltransferase involved in cell wall biosynthesis
VVNGVDCKQFYLKIPEEERPDTLFFSGNFRYGPNRHAVNHFLENIFPLIRRSKPNVRLSIVGNDAAPFMRRSHPAATGVEVHDYVVHLRPHLAAATVAVAPITVGSGVSNKVMEAFAVGTSIVSTSMACGDLPVRDGDHLYIADAPEVFASRVVALLSDRGLREQMARRAHELAAREYDWEVVAGSMERVLFDAAGEPPAGRSRTGVTARAALSQTAEV